MKNFLKKFAVFLGIITAISATSTLVLKTPAFADDTRMDGSSCTEDSFFGLTPWDCGVGDINNEEDLKSGIANIATNILTDLTVIASYLVLGYVIYGGYLYMFSAGDPGKAATGKKTLTYAFIGLAITISAFVIFSSIRIALLGSQGKLDCDYVTGAGCISDRDDAASMIAYIVQWVGGIAGAVAAIFLVVGAWGYMTSNGDPNKLQKAKTTILYAIIGLIIVALAEVLTAFISSIIRDANKEQSFIQDTSIVQEIANKTKEENEKV